MSSRGLETKTYTWRRDEKMSQLKVLKTLKRVALTESNGRKKSKQIKETNQFKFTSFVIQDCELETQ